MKTKKVERQYVNRSTGQIVTEKEMFPTLAPHAEDVEQPLPDLQQAQWDYDMASQIHEEAQKKLDLALSKLHACIHDLDDARCSRDYAHLHLITCIEKNDQNESQK